MEKQTLKIEYGGYPNIIIDACMTINKNIYVDGYDPETNTVFEYNGCKHHECDCIHIDKKNKIIEYWDYHSRKKKKIKYEDKFKTLEEIKKRNSSCSNPRNQECKTYTTDCVRMKHACKMALLRRLGFNTVTIRECDMKRLMKIDQKLKEIYHDITKNKKGSLKENLEIRNSLHGGRTDLCKIYFGSKNKSNNNFKINYYDVVSLYPYICSVGPFPVGKPEYIIYDFDYSLNSYFGFVYCKVLPPKNLYHPVLGTNIRNKFIFPLCRKCAEKADSTEICNHSNEERFLEDIWTTEELKKAIQKGYKILKIYKVINYKEKSTDLFTSYMEIFFYIKNKAEKEGNSGYRFIAKIMLNNLWGKFCQRSGMRKPEFITSEAEFLKLLSRNNIENLKIENIHLSNKVVHLATYVNSDEKNQEGNSQNVAIGAFTTSLARLKLYEALELLDERVLYHDTDSVVWVDDGGVNFPSRDGLGNFKNEFEKKEKKLNKKIWATEFLATAPKSYAYILNTGEKEMKIKGISLNQQEVQLIQPAQYSKNGKENSV